MFKTFKNILSTSDRVWYETLPVFCGVSLVIIDILIRAVKKKKLIDVARIAFLVSEGVSVTIIGVFIVMLYHDKPTALKIADKNDKIMFVAMLISFIMITHHIYEYMFKEEKIH